MTRSARIGNTPSRGTMLRWATVRTTPFLRKNMSSAIILVFFLSLLSTGFAADKGMCEVPFTIQGQWFSVEAGVKTVTEFSIHRLNASICVDIMAPTKDNFTFIFHEEARNCFRCVRILVRTINVLEKTQSECVKLNDRPTLERVCRELDPKQELVTMFSENPTPVNCRASLEGVWTFAYQRRDMFTGECISPDANITSCQAPGSQFQIENEQFIINYRKCDGMERTFNADVKFNCLGQWFVGKNQYFAAVNSRETRKDEKYRCFLKNRDDDLNLGATMTADCSILKTPQESPERFRLTPVKAELVRPGCNLPQNFTGQWINTAKIDAEVFMNNTHIIETWYPDKYRFRRHIYVCLEQRDTRYMMARLGVDGCQKDHICWDFVPRHHNIIRFRQGLVTWKSDFHTVCSWVYFPPKRAWNYDLLIAKNPVTIRCPVAGKFRFVQKGEMPFRTRIRGGVTQSPRPSVYCKENISDFSVCDKDQKEMAIDAVYCLSVNRYGQPVDIYSEPDYIMKCIGYWKENLKSYLITMDEEDAFSQYRCWVYQRADLNRIIMSYSVGPFCNLNQQATSSKYSEGAVVALNMTEYEREHDDCPMFFDDGSNPWVKVDKVVNRLVYSGCQQFQNNLGLLLSSIFALLYFNVL